jgi:chromosome segregation ATPase
MAKVGAQRAAELTGRSKSTIQRAMNNGKISFELDANGRRVIDVSELERALGLQQAGGGNNNSSVEQELQKASSMLEAERAQMRIKMLEQQLQTAQDQINDLKGQRDQWQKQAAQVLITSQYSQKQAEELKAELQAREQRARAKRQQMLEEGVRKLKPQNENATAQDQAAAQESGFQGFWKKVKGQRA